MVRQEAYRCLALSAHPPPGQLGHGYCEALGVAAGNTGDPRTWHATIKAVF